MQKRTFQANVHERALQNKLKTLHQFPVDFRQKKLAKQIPAENLWYSAKRAGVERAGPNKVMAHMWFMHDAHLGCAFLFLEILAGYTLLSMTVMVTPCLWYVLGM